MDKFAKYNAYSANNERAMECLDKLLKENSGFTTLCDEVKRLEPSKQQDIAGYLVKPFQRICRYQLLLQELHKHTPSTWEDHENLGTAVAAINKLVTGANETKRITDNLYKLTDIRNRFKAVRSPRLLLLARSLTHSLAHSFLVCEAAGARSE